MKCTNSLYWNAGVRCWEYLGAIQHNCLIVAYRCTAAVEKEHTWLNRPFCAACCRCVHHVQAALLFLLFRLPTQSCAPEHSSAIPRRKVTGRKVWRHGIKGSIEHARNPCRISVQALNVIPMCKGRGEGLCVWVPLPKKVHKGLLQVVKARFHVNLHNTAI
jgi:hypothetical protein